MLVKVALEAFCRVVTSGARINEALLQRVKRDEIVIHRGFHFVLVNARQLSNSCLQLL